MSTELAPEGVEEYDESADIAAEEAIEEVVEQAVEEAPEEEQPKVPDGMVPHGALHEERRKRQESDARLQRMEQRWEQYVDPMLRAQAPAEPTIPDAEEDPIEALKFVQETLVKQQQNAEQQQQAQQQQQAFSMRVGAMESEARGTHEDYDQALAFAREQRVNDYKALGYDPATATQMVGQDEQSLAITAMQNGGNAAMDIYNFAKARGYAAKSQENPIEQIEQRKEAAKSISGGSAKKSVSFSALSEMDDDEFAKNFEKIWGSS